MFPLIDEAIVGAVELQRREPGCLPWLEACVLLVGSEAKARQDRRIQSATEAD